MVGQIGHGLLALVGIGASDGSADLAYIVTKATRSAHLQRRSRQAHRSVLEAGGAVLVVSQFTLYGDCRKGRRPSFLGAASPGVARPLYEDLLRRLRADDLPVEAGEFQATMQVELLNDGPVTILLDSARSD